MLIDRAKFAAYTDEAGDDPSGGIETLASHGIKNVCIRQLWVDNVINSSDQGVRKYKALLDERGMRAVMLAPDLGNVPAHELDGERAKLDRAFLLASYYGVQFIKFGVGRQTTESWNGAVSAWMEDVQVRSIRANVTPLLEPSWDAAPLEPTDLVRLLNTYPRWRLLYDPAQLVLQRRIDPFVKYWTLLKSRVAAMDVRDLKIGQSFRPAGQGDCRVELTLRDAVESKYIGWYFLEPGLGRRYGPALTRRDTFALAVEALGNLEAL